MRIQKRALWLSLIHILEAGEQILFDAPTLFVGTRNTGFDLLSGVRAVSDDGQTVPVKVKDDSELDAARVTVTDEETGQELSLIHI